MMEGIRIRSSRFTGEGSRLVDLTLGVEHESGPSAHIAYPYQVDRLAEKHADAFGTSLLIRLSSWDGEKVSLLYDPRTVPFFGGDGCLVDLAAGYGDRQEIESLAILSGARREAHSLGLPVVCRVIFNPGPYLEDIANCLSVPLTIAEEMGADAIILPGVAEGELARLRRPMVPYFRTVTEGIYESRPI